jgi:hypothetical protein
MTTEPKPVATLDSLCDKQATLTAMAIELWLLNESSNSPDINWSCALAWAAKQIASGAYKDEGTKETPNA